MTVHQPNDLASKASAYIERIENLMADRETIKGEMMAKCREIADDIKEVVGEAKSVGVAVKPLKAIIKRRTLQKRIDGLPAEFDIDEAAQFDVLARAFCDTPMGGYFAKRADETRKPDDGDDKDLRPRHLRQPGASVASEAPARPDEEALGKVGRGRGRKAASEDAVDQLASTH